MRYLTATGIVLALLCTAAASLAQTNPNTLKDQLTGDAKGSAAANPQCKLFTRAEVAAYVGMPVGPGQNNSGGAGCRWSYKEYEAWATVSVVPPNYFPEPNEVKGFKRLPSVGKKAWVAPDSGWSAGAIVGDKAFVVVVYGKNASELAAVSMLQEAIKRGTK
ncbi:MAG: hypothetical protein H7315_00940 [Herminiimonas sp.]|nr:hypothetical protein [Herminiimonas sp.]